MFRLQRKQVWGVLKASYNQRAKTTAKLFFFFPTDSSQPSRDQSYKQGHLRLNNGDRKKYFPKGIVKQHRNIVADKRCRIQSTLGAWGHPKPANLMPTAESILLTKRVINHMLHSNS